MLEVAMMRYGLEAVARVVALNVLRWTVRRDYFFDVALARFVHRGVGIGLVAFTAGFRGDGRLLAGGCYFFHAPRLADALRGLSIFRVRH